MQLYPNLPDLIAVLFPMNSTARPADVLAHVVEKLVRVYGLPALLDAARSTNNIDLSTGIQAYVNRRGIQKRLSFSFDLHL